MENWRKELYQFYSSNKGNKIKEIEKDCTLFKYKIQKQLPSKKDTSIIDLAAGHGSFMYCLKKAGYTNVIGIDISEEEVKIAETNGIKDIFQDDIFHFLENTDKKFDVIIMMDILEHLTRDEFFRILHLAKNTLNKNGLMIAQVPNATGIFGMRIRYGDLTHETSFSHNSVIQGFTTVGFNKIKTHEIAPIKRGIKGIIRNYLWHLLVFPHRLIILLETGKKKHILSQNMLITAIK